MAMSTAEAKATITRVYNDLLERDPNFNISGGASYWIDQFKSGNSSEQALRGAVQQSDEYKYILPAFKSNFGRPPNLQERNWLIKKLEDGTINTGLIDTIVQRHKQDGDLDIKSAVYRTTIDEGLKDGSYGGQASTPQQPSTSTPSTPGPSTMTEDQAKSILREVYNQELERDPIFGGPTTASYWIEPLMRGQETRGSLTSNVRNSDEYKFVLPAFKEYFGRPPSERERTAVIEARNSGAIQPENINTVIEMYKNDPDFGTIDNSLYKFQEQAGTLTQPNTPKQVGEGPQTPREKITSLYQNILQRDPVFGGPNTASHWLDQLASGNMNEQQIAESIRNSDEKKIVDLYERTLGRAPGADERKGYLEQLTSGQKTLEDIKGFMENSPEALSYDGRPFTAGVDNQLKEAYRAILGREPDPKGFEYWKDMIQTQGWDINDVTNAFKASPEYKARQTLLGEKYKSNVQNIALEASEGPREAEVVDSDTIRDVGIMKKDVGHVGATPFATPAQTGPVGQVDKNALIPQRGPQPTQPTSVGFQDPTKIFGGQPTTNTQLGPAPQQPQQAKPQQDELARITQQEQSGAITPFQAQVLKDKLQESQGNVKMFNTGGLVDGTDNPNTTPVTQDMTVETQALPDAGQLGPAAQTGIAAANIQNPYTVAQPQSPYPSAFTMAPVTSQEGVAGTLGAMPTIQGELSEGSTVSAQQMNPYDSAALNLQAEQIDQAQQVQDPGDRVAQEGELLQPGMDTVNMRAVNRVADIQAAQGQVTEESTVQGQMAKLMQDFEGGETPPWAAGALRNATAQMQARGLGASSIAGQALVQAAMESAIPIAAQDAQVYENMNIRNLDNRQQAVMEAARMRAQFLGKKFDQKFQTAVYNADKITNLAGQTYQKDVQIALENSRLAQQVDVANLNARQAKLMADAAALTNIDTQNLNNRQQAAVANAQHFLQMDMTNLDMLNEQTMFKAQQNIQSMFADQAAVNAARQFNAASEQQTEQFFANLSSTVSQFNASQYNAMEQFNTSEMNAMSRFNSDIQNQRDMFNAQNSLIVAQANAQWRQNIATLEMQAENQAKRDYAMFMNQMSASTLDQYWQRESDILSYAFTAAESSSDRAMTVLLENLRTNAQQEALKMQADIEAKAGRDAALGGLAATALDGVMEFVGGLF